MNCQRALLGERGILALASWTLFSPKKTWPTSTAARMVSGGCDLDTASRVTESSVRPARWQAAAMRCRMECKFSAKVTN